jgi:hypothetical protein
MEHVQMVLSAEATSLSAPSSESGVEHTATHGKTPRKNKKTGIFQREICTSLFMSYRW